MFIFSLTLTKKWLPHDAHARVLSHTGFHTQTFASAAGNAKSGASYIGIRKDVMAFKMSTEYTHMIKSLTRISEWYRVTESDERARSVTDRRQYHRVVPGQPHNNMLKHPLMLAVFIVQNQKLWRVSRLDV